MATQQSPKILDFAVTTVYNGELAPWALKGSVTTPSEPSVVTAHTHEMVDVIGLIPALNAKADISHTHVRADITDFDHTHPSSDITDLESCEDCLDRILVSENQRVLVGNGNVLYRAA